MGTRADKYVALLRGINVGGRNKLPMQALKALFVAAGCDDVTTYIQSGNVVFCSEDASGLGASIARDLEAQHGLRAPVILRSAPDLRNVLAANPFLVEGSAPECLHVAFLQDMPDTARVRALDPERSPPDRFAVLSREIYLNCPNGYGMSKLTNAYFDSRLDTVSTVRNWRTIQALCAMMDESST